LKEILQINCLGTSVWLESREQEELQRQPFYYSILKKNYGQSSEALYVSLDDLYFSEHILSDFVEEFVAKEGAHLFLDEVHKYKNWSLELKNIYDTYKELKVVFTGSYLLEILNYRSDLSRRALVYKMQ
tara:strand:- start:10912 stop:11298 length:387 start_codon:yes stop_codon:yes gene_type:complete